MLTGVDGNGPKRFSVQRKMAIVARLLRGEPLELVARETNVSIARLTEWRDRALAGAATALKDGNQRHRRLPFWPEPHTARVRMARKEDSTAQSVCAVLLIPEPHTARAGSSLALVAVGLHPLASYPNDQCLRLFRMIKRLAKPT